MIRRAALALAVAATFAVATPTATAAPSGEVFEMRCGLEEEDADLDAYDFEALGDEAIKVTNNPGWGIWTPAFVVGSNERLVPYAFDIVVETPRGEETRFAAKPAPQNGQHDLCAFVDGFGAEYGFVRVTSTAH